MGKKIPSSVLPDPDVKFIGDHPQGKVFWHSRRLPDGEGPAADGKAFFIDANDHVSMAHAGHHQTHKQLAACNLRPIERTNSVILFAVNRAALNQVATNWVSANLRGAANHPP